GAGTPAGARPLEDSACSSLLASRSRRSSSSMSSTSDGAGPSPRGADRPRTPRKTPPKMESRMYSPKRAPISSSNWMARHLRVAPPAAVATGTAGATCRRRRSSTASGRAFGLVVGLLARLADGLAHFRVGHNVAHGVVVHDAQI